MLKLIKKQVEIEKVDALGNKETKHYTNFYIQLDNGSYIAVKPAFQNDYKVLYIVAENEQPDYM